MNAGERRRSIYALYGFLSVPSVGAGVVGMLLSVRLSPTLIEHTLIFFGTPARFDLVLNNSLLAGAVGLFVYLMLRNH